jgi:hypothetical protein
MKKVRPAHVKPIVDWQRFVISLPNELAPAGTVDDLARYALVLRLSDQRKSSDWGTHRRSKNLRSGMAKSEMIVSYQGLRWKGKMRKNKLAEEGSEMSFCLGKRYFFWGPDKWSPSPRTHALCQGKPPWAGQQN